MRSDKIPLSVEDGSALLRAVEAAGHGAESRDFAGRFVEDLFVLLGRRLPAAAVAGIARAAGEQELGRDGSEPWISYARFRRLLEESARALGGREALREFGGATSDGTSGAEAIALLQSFGTPEVMLAALSSLVANMMPVLDLEAAQVAPREWVLSVTVSGGREFFPELCSILAGQYQAIPPIYGYEQVEVCEEDDGHDVSFRRFRLRWAEVEPAVRERQFALLQARLSAARLEQFQELVLNIAQHAEPQEVLRRIVRATARAVAAPQCAVVLNDDGVNVEQVIAEGFCDEDLEHLRAMIAGPPERRPDCLVVELIAGHERYGYLVVIDTGARLYTRSPGLVETYARLAAGFVAMTTAVQASERDARTARSLLDLSRSLVNAVTADEVALKLAHAAPSIIGCRRAAVFLIDDETAEPRLAATDGFTSDEVIALRALEFNAAVGEPDTAPDEGHLAPISAHGEPAGWLLVDGVAERSSGWQPLDQERLCGLAAQGASAISNVQLVDEIRHQALHDPLTGLPNRALILDRAEHMLARSDRLGTSIAALFIDLDGFKGVNDTFGHDAGDALLQAVAGRLTATARAADTVGRLGGDEFVVLIDGASSDAAPELVAERIITLLREPFLLAETDNTPLLLSASVGIASGDRLSSAEMLRDADIALYEAKATGKNRFVTFAAEMQTTMQDRLLLEMDLRGALDGEQFLLLYQPIFNLETAVITGVEALLRWHHPRRGIIEPDDFIPLLEQSGMIVDVGRWVLSAACREAARLHAIGHLLSISVNVSIRQLERVAFLDEVRDTLKASGLRPAALVLEVTETALMRDIDTVLPSLEALRALGVRIAIDDFGTGYSSLAYLQQLPVDTIKIDRSFVSAMAGSPESRALVHTLVQLGRSLHLETLAEGIEQQSQHTTLRHEHCDSGQGYLLARPLSVDALEQLLGSEATSPQPA